MRRAPRSLLSLAAALAAALVSAALPARAHVGSPNVLFDGDAGPYPVRVIVRPPPVIPGDTEITVRLREGRKADRVTLQPALFEQGFKGAPPPDVARPVHGAPGVWSGRFLLMKEGSWSIRVRVQGPQGEGMVQVPMPAFRRRILRMDEGLGALLVALGAFLFLGAVAIIGAAVRDASLPRGQVADVQRRSSGRAAAVLAAFLLALAVWGGKGWWDSTDAQLRQKLFKPFGVRTTVRRAAGRPLLALKIDPQSGRWAPLIPDHGKLMHLFLLREPGLDAFAHLHPLAQGPQDFLAAVPPLPAGTYRLYADIVDENGFPETLVDRVQVPATAAAGAGGGAGPEPDPDDSWRLAAPPAAAAAGGPVASPLEDGGTMIWYREPLAAERETTLRFEVRGADGRPAVLEPYMGMQGHAVITREDGGVFVHLHPMGTVSMAAQQVFAGAPAGPTAGVPGMAGMAGMDPLAHPAPAGSGAGALSIPYEFPQPGRYRMWVQVKSAGRVLTGVFAIDVPAAG